MTRLALLAALLLCGATAPASEASLATGELYSAVERHWLAYAELQRQKDLRPQ